VHEKLTDFDTFASSSAALIASTVYLLTLVTHRQPLEWSFTGASRLPSLVQPKDMDHALLVPNKHCLIAYTVLLTCGIVHWCQELQSTFSFSELLPEVESRNICLYMCKTVDPVGTIKPMANHS